MKIFGKNVLFGTDLFNFKKRVEPGLMYDFAQHGLFTSSMEMGNIISVEQAVANVMGKKSKSKKKEKTVDLVISPKGLYQLKTLNDNDFKILADKEYLEKQISGLKEKLALLPKRLKIKVRRNEFWGVPEQAGGGSIEYARQELESMIERLENRYQLTSEKQSGLMTDVVCKYPHTTAKLISDVIQVHTHLRCQKADSFVPDFPGDAIKAMKEYDEMCIELCGKKTHFYVIASAKDFETRNRRRDPILLAQSPFGFFWQILGAWDEEMIYLGEL